MAARPVWKGQLRLSLVSIPVELFSATRSGGRVSFRQIHKPSGKPVRYEKTVPGVGPVDNEDIWKGYEVGKDEYVLLSPDEIDEVKIESRKTLELVQFVGACEIPPIYFDRPYFIAPQDELSEDAYRVVRDALAQTQKVALGQLAMRGREYLVAVRPCANGLMLETLRYADEIRESERFFSGIDGSKADKEMVSVATELIERKTRPFDAESFHDSYEEAIRELVASRSKARKSRRIQTEEGSGRGGDNVVDLMAALKKSLEKSGAGKAKKTAARHSGSSSPRRSSKKKRA